MTSTRRIACYFYNVALLNFNVVLIIFIVILGIVLWDGSKCFCSGYCHV